MAIHNKKNDDDNVKFKVNMFSHGLKMQSVQRSILKDVKQDMQFKAAPKASLQSLSTLLKSILKPK